MQAKDRGLKVVPVSASDTLQSQNGVCGRDAGVESVVVKRVNSESTKVGCSGNVAGAGSRSRLAWLGFEQADLRRS